MITPENLNTIESDAFKGCGNLKEISLSAAIRTIEQDAFHGADNLDYETMFKAPAQAGASISIADSWLNTRYDEILGKVKIAKTDLSSKKKIPLYVYPIAAVLLIGLGLLIKSHLDLKNQIETAESYVSDRKYEKPVEVYQTILDEKPGNSKASAGLDDAYLAWGDNLLDQEKYEDAIDTYSNMTDSDSAIANAYAIWSDQLAAAGDYQSALSILETSKAAHPGIISALEDQIRKIESEQCIADLKNDLSGNTYTGEYNDGIVKVLGTEEADGRSVKVIYYTADKKAFSYFTNDSSYESKHTIYGF